MDGSGLWIFSMRVSMYEISLWLQILVYKIHSREVEATMKRLKCWSKNVKKWKGMLWKTGRRTVFTDNS